MKKIYTKCNKEAIDIFLFSSFVLRTEKEPSYVYVTIMYI